MPLEKESKLLGDLVMLFILTDNNVPLTFYHYHYLGNQGHVTKAVQNMSYII